MDTFLFIFFLLSTYCFFMHWSTFFQSLHGGLKNEQTQYVISMGIIECFGLSSSEIYTVLPHSIVLFGRRVALIFLYNSFTFTYRCLLTSLRDWTVKGEAEHQMSLSLCSFHTQVLTWLAFKRKKKWCINKAALLYAFFYLPGVQL